MFSQGNCTYSENYSSCDYSILTFGAGYDKNANVFVRYNSNQCMITYDTMAGCWN